MWRRIASGNVGIDKLDAGFDRWDIFFLVMDSLYSRQGHIIAAASVERVKTEPIDNSEVQSICKLEGLGKLMN